MWSFNEQTTKTGNEAFGEPIDARIERLREEHRKALLAAREAERQLDEALLEKAETTHVRLDPDLDPLRRWA